MSKKEEPIKSLNEQEAKMLQLITSGKAAFNLLLEEVSKPIDTELRDDQARNAMKAKKECFMDAKEILAEVQRLELQLTGDAPAESEEEGHFKGGFAEAFAKNKK